MNDLAGRLAELLTRANMKPADLAHRSGTSKTYISRVLRGERTNPSARIIQAWSQALQCQPGAFF